MKTAPRILCCGIAIFAAAALGACGGSSSPAASTPATDTTSVSNAVPSDVVLASPTASTAGSSNIAVKSLHKALAGDATGQSYEEKKAAAEALHAGTGECGFTPSLTLPTRPACYGPTVTFANHADSGGQQVQPSGTLPGSDTGFWNLSEGTEACAAAQMNYLIAAVSTRVDTMINMFNNMACVGKKNNIELPAIGATADLKAALGEKSTMTGVTVNVATIERLADDADGNPVYKSTVSVTIGTSTGTAILKHIKTGDGTYKGKLSMTMTNETEVAMGGPEAAEGAPPPEGQGQPQGQNFSNCTGSAAGSVHAAVVSYVKSSAASVVYEMNFAEFCGADATPLDANNNIVRTDIFDESTNLTGWGNDWNYGLFNLNPSNGTGTVAYAWQAGKGDGRTRVMNATVTEDAAGAGSGVAYYGYGPSVNGSETLGTIEGFICNWAGPNGAISNGVGDAARAHSALIASTPAKEVSKAQKQILTRAAGGTVYTTTASDSKIAYAPSNSCDKGQANSTFTFYAVDKDNNTLSQTNDITDTTLVTNDLVDVDEITTNFTLPTPPTDVGG